MWVVPDDVRIMTGDGALKPVNAELVIPCRACSERAPLSPGGRQNKNTVVNNKAV